MGIGIRIENLRKVYTSPPPMAARGAGFSFSGVRSARTGKAAKKLEIVALDGISLDIQPGEVIGLLGPNGAGKSTTIGVLTTRTRPTAGRAFIGEFDVWREQVKAKRLIGVVPQRPNLDFALTARELLLYHGAYFGQSARERERRASELLERFKLTDRADQMVRAFSGGMMQRLSIARAMMHDPEVLFLDEPSAGLDPQTRLLLWEIVRGYHQQDAVNPTDARQHVFDESLMPGNIDKSNLEAFELEVAEAQVDSNAAELFLFQPVGVHAGESFHQCTLAVVDVPGSSDDHVAHMHHRDVRNAGASGRWGTGALKLVLLVSRHPGALAVRNALTEKSVISTLNRFAGSGCLRVLLPARKR